MGWIEKLRRAAEEREAKLRQDQEEARLKAEQERIWVEQKKQKELQQQAHYQQLPQMLEKFHPRKLLDDIRDQVWNTPKAQVIFYNDSSKSTVHYWGSIGYELVYSYPSGAKDTRRYGSPPEGTFYEYTGKINWGHSSTKLVIEAGILKPGLHISEPVPYLQVQDSAVRLYGIPGANHFPGLYPGGYRSLSYDPSGDYIDIRDPQAAEKLEELLMRSCLRRVKDGSLPLQLEISARREIESLKRARWRGTYWEDH